MPYLLETNDNSLLIVNHTSSNDLYYQVLSSYGLSRPTILLRNIDTFYTATIDSNNSYHILVQNSKHQVIQITINDSNISRTILLDDAKQVYNFSNLFLTLHNNNLNMLYTVKNPNTNNYNLIHHILCNNNNFEPYPILSFQNNNVEFKYLSVNNNIYILYISPESNNSLKLIIYKNNIWEEPINLLTSDFPIDNFEFYIDNNDSIHLVYLQEKYGIYNLFYKPIANNLESSLPDKLLYTGSISLELCIFAYNRGIWVNLIENNTLKMILSTDNGNNFSTCINCSSSDSNWEAFNFINNSSSKDYFIRRLYVSFSPVFKVGIISNINTTDFIPNEPNNNELELLIDGLLHAAYQVPSNNSDNIIKSLENEKAEIIEKYNEMAELTRKIQEEGKKWRDKALKLESNIEN